MMRTTKTTLAVWIALLLVGATTLGMLGARSEPPAPDLGRALDTLRASRFVDLTHSFEPGIPHWPGLPDEKKEVLYGYEKGTGTMGSGFLIQRYSFAGQWGTHVDAPAHFIKGLRSVDQISVREMVLPLAVIDLHEAAGKNADLQISMDDVRRWEMRHGPIPKGAFIAMRTDWCKRWPDAKKMRNADANNAAHYPGWSADVLKHLFRERLATAIGHETTDTDPGVATSKNDYSLEHYVLSQDRYQIELLANLHDVPEAGGIAIVTFPKPKAGSGFPARVFAIVPQEPRTK